MVRKCFLCESYEEDKMFSEHRKEGFVCNACVKIERVFKKLKEKELEEK